MFRNLNYQGLDIPQLEIARYLWSFYLSVVTDIGIYAEGSQCRMLLFSVFARWMLSGDLKFTKN